MSDTHSNITLNRRSVIASASGAAVLTALTGASASAAASPAKTGGPENWKTVTDLEMRRFKRERFTVLTDDGHTARMTLVKTEACKSGPARPKHLPRKEGVTAIFVSDDMQYFVENGAQTVTVKHSALGTERLYITAVPRKNGRHFLEVVLN